MLCYRNGTHNNYLLTVLKIASAIVMGPVNCSSGAFCTSSTVKESTSSRCFCSTTRGWLSIVYCQNNAKNASPLKYSLTSKVLLRISSCVLHISWFRVLFAQVCCVYSIKSSLIVYFRKHGPYKRVEERITEGHTVCIIHLNTFATGSAVGRVDGISHSEEHSTD